MKRIRKNNSGYSLVELVVVIGIVSVMMVGVVFGLSVLNNKEIDECSKKIKIALEGNRVTTMGKYEAEIAFYVDSKNCLMVEETFDNSTKVTRIGGESLKIKYECNGNQNMIPSSPNKLTIRFDRSSGALKTQTDGGDDVGHYVTKFIVGVDSSNPAEVTIEHLTGRVSIN